MSIIRKNQKAVKNKRSHLLRTYAFDEKLYAKLRIEDIRSNETLGKKLGVSKETIRRSLVRQEARGWLRLDPLPNRKRLNPRFRKVKRGVHDRIKVEDLFRAPNFKTWKTKARDQLIKRYMLMRWNIVPCRDKAPIKSRKSWAAMSQKKQLAMFADQSLGVGMWINDVVVFDFDNFDHSKDAPPDYNTLMTKTKHGYHIFFTRTPESKHITETTKKVAPNIDTKTRRSFLVLPPSDGYEWFKLQTPVAVPKELLEAWDHRKKKSETAAVASSAKVGASKYVLPPTIPYGSRRATLFAFGRSLPRTLAVVNDRLRAINQSHCKPPVVEKRMLEIINDVLNKPNKPSPRMGKK
jgi:hypothetical protein